MKKLSVLLLVVATLFNNFAPVVVIALGDLDSNPSSSTEILTDFSNYVPKGNIEVETQLVLPIRNREKNNIQFTIMDSSKNTATIDLNDIQSAKDGYYESTITLGEQKNIRIVATKRGNDGSLLSGVDYNNNIVYFSINLYSLNQGTYQLKFSGTHFKTYEFPVTLDDFSKRISVTDEKGMFEIGDMNQDGKVDETDSNLMMEAIDTGKEDYDLNLDGTVDIADLNYITAILTGTSKSVKIENTSAIISPETVSFEDTGITVEGSLSDLFQEEGTVTLKPANGEEVSKKNPINLTMDLAGKEESAIEMSEIRIGVGDNAPTEMTLFVETEKGTEEYKYSAKDTPTSQGIHLFTEEVSEGTIVISLKNQVAVKKVTIKVTETSGNNLAEIAKVEFLNNVKLKTKQPEGFYVPKNVKVDESVSEQLTVTFDPVENVTGYEISIVGPKIDRIFQTTFTSFTIEDLKNYQNYTIKVQAANQEWRSGWSEKIVASPKASRKPPAPDMVKGEATFGGIVYSWKAMDDTLTYNLYYRKQGDSDWTKISELKTPSYTLKGLEGNATYEAYVTGNNPNGEGDESAIVTTTVLEAGAAIVPKYGIINDYNGTTGKTNHIENIISTKGTYTNDDKWALVDDDFQTDWSYNDWTVGTYNDNAGYPIIELDQAYEMDEFVLTVPDTWPYQYKQGGYGDNKDAAVYYWSSEGEYTKANQIKVPAVITRKKDVNGRYYYVVKLEKPITAKAVQFGLTVASNGKPVILSEVKFYHYDSLVNDVKALFKDDLRIELADGVTQTMIDQLRTRANTKKNGEYSPYQESVLNDLEYAEKILNDEKLDDVIELNPNISNSYNGHLGFAMTISDYQPLGIAVRPGDQITIYAGSTGKVNVDVMITQYYAEASAWNKKVITLQKGQNIIDIPEVTTESSLRESGGSVYVRFNSTPDVNNPVKIRVSGGTKIPMLDTSRLTDEASKKAAIQEYIETLDAYVEALPNMYAKEGKTFEATKSALGATEIVTTHGLWSVSAVAVKNALYSGTTSLDQRVERLYESTEAFDEMMEMFYRQKGLSKNAEDPKDEMPKARINIRYMKMFDGAFMYAGGYHIGIEYGSIAGLVQAHRNTEDATGYFGWGISHEIGHQINQSSLVHAEVTNNVYALLAQTSNDKDTSRLEDSGIYEKIYDKVTSHTIGKPQNVFVTLGMYWQLHLAYDDEKTFTDQDSIYARINHLTRTYEKKTEFKKDDLLVILASKAAGYDLTDFFATWGIKASEEAIAEIDSFKLPQEERAIYYLNDKARRYRLETNQRMSTDTKVTAQITTASSKDKRVTLTFEVDQDEDKILGYEILRNGVSIGFVEGDVHEFVDNIGAENNRAYTYEVVAYDYLLNKTESAKLEEIKISHDGSVEKGTFTIVSNVKEAGEDVDYEDENVDFSALKVNHLIDGDTKTGFKGTEKIKTLNQTTDRPSLSVDNGNAYVIINLNNPMSISGIKYRAIVEDGALADNTIKNYKISVSSTGEDGSWIVARTGTFQVTPEKPEETVYFMGQGTTSQTQLWTYHDVAYVKIESDGNKNGLSGAEIDVIAPPGDNIDIDMESEDVPAFGKLTEDYCYLKDGCDDSVTDDDGDVVGKIKAGSVIIKGTYRGNPGFNVVTIGDPNDEKKIYSGYQIIFAELNADNSVYEVAEGSWIYVMTQAQYEEMLSKTSAIRAYLYRVNDAETNDGQRITSTSKTISHLPTYDQLKNVTLDNSK